VIDAPDSVFVGVTVTDATLFTTFTVYEVILGLNVMEPELIVSKLRD
jgi:hypothetical protein